MAAITTSTFDMLNYVSEKAATTAFGKVPPPVKQLDCDCGIYAMYGGLNFSSIQSTKKRFAIPPRSLTPTANKGNPKAANSSIRQVAKVNGFSQIGELFDASQVPELARQLGGKAEVRDLASKGDLYKEIKKAIDANRTVMVPYCNNKGEPKTDGKNAHWALVFGYYEDTPFEHLLATHWGWYWDWDADDVAESNFSIADWVTTDYEKVKPHDWNPAAATSGGTDSVTATATPLKKTRRTGRLFVADAGEEDRGDWLRQRRVSD